VRELVELVRTRRRLLASPQIESEDVTIRRASPDDLDTVAALLSAFRDWWGSSTPSDETFRATAAKLLHDPNTEYLLAGTSGLAQLRYRLSVWTGVEDCWLEDLFVADDARGTGLGSALIEACFDRARARGCRRIELDVNESNRHALRLYERMGFSLAPKGPGRTLFLGAKL
jgi:ribosomal protein S18 acetylase RimI-like enzyme